VFASHAYLLRVDRFDTAYKTLETACGTSFLVYLDALFNTFLIRRARNFYDLDRVKWHACDIESDSTLRSSSSFLYFLSFVIYNSSVRRLFL
jgi:hypothetical protein